MRIAILADDHQINFLKSKSEHTEWVIADDFGKLLKTENADAYFNLNDQAATEDYSGIFKPVFINSVTLTLTEKKHGKNVIRLNAWKGFLNRTVWEIAGGLDDSQLTILNELKQKYISLPDEPGFVSARILSMIINEGFFAKEQGVSTEDEIDIAMKLGTNYPRGPFEWMREIGIKNILDLLTALAKTDSRYQPSTLLIQEASH